MKIKFLGLLSLVVLFAFTACDNNEATTGKASFYLTDGPMEADNVSGVFITFTSVEVSGPAGWETVKTYEEPQTVNLLDLQNGETFFIEEAELTAGSYGQVRLGLLNNENADPLNNYVAFTDGSVEAITVPSGDQTGYKVVGGFTIPAGGVTAVTIDFDVRKSVVNTGSGKYMLKPTLRLVENADAALINGVVNVTAESNYVVYAYADDTYTSDEETANADGVFFANAVTSANVDAEGNFTVAFLNSGIYDLYLASYDADGNLVAVEAIDSNVELAGGASLDITVEITL